jgi:hypothetical protein
VAEALDVLLDPQGRERGDVLNGLADVRSKLGTPGAAARVAQMASELVGARG